MEWYHYLAAFLGGAFLANAVPHYVYGIAGDKFPTPFAKPPGRGLSLPTLNVVWALVNMVIGYALTRAGKVSNDNMPSLLTFFAGIAAMSIMASITFSKKDREQQ